LKKEERDCLGTMLEFSNTGSGAVKRITGFLESELNGCSICLVFVLGVMIRVVMFIEGFTYGSRVQTKEIFLNGSGENI